MPHPPAPAPFYSGAPSHGTPSNEHPTFPPDGSFLPNDYFATAQSQPQHGHHAPLSHHQQPHQQPHQHPAPDSLDLFGLPNHQGLYNFGVLPPGVLPQQHQQPQPQQPQQQQQQQPLQHQHQHQPQPQPQPQPQQPYVPPSNAGIGLPFGFPHEVPSLDPSFSPAPSFRSDGPQPLQPYPRSSDPRADRDNKPNPRFVSKLFYMLEAGSWNEIIRWSLNGDSFIVVNMNDFTKHVLPKHFKHSNFSSFVRQLNKYDFHKMKKDPTMLGKLFDLSKHEAFDQMWEFKHDCFQRGRPDLLESVQRKAPLVKRGGLRAAVEENNDESSSTVPQGAEAVERAAEEYADLKEQISGLQAIQDSLTKHIGTLTNQYQNVITDMVRVQQNIKEQDQLMQHLIRHVAAGGSVTSASPAGTQSSSSIQQPNSPSTSSETGPFLPPAEAQKLIGSYQTVAQASFAQMSDIAQRVAQGLHAIPSALSAAAEAASAQSTSATVSQAARSAKAKAKVQQQNGEEAVDEDDSDADAGDEPTREQPPSPHVFLHPPHFDVFHQPESLLSVAGEEGSEANAEQAAIALQGLGASGGLRIFTLGTLQLFDHPDQSGTQAMGQGKSPTPALDGRQRLPVYSLEELPRSMPMVDRRASGPVASNDQNAKTLRVRRSTYIPGWAVPPAAWQSHESERDALARSLSRKFIPVVGAAIDVPLSPEDTSLDLSRYELVLLDVVLPSLDSVSADSLIKQFDPRTPIISITSDVSTVELQEYMRNGMNDGLPTAFTARGLLNMIDKHLIHLKTVQKLDQIPKSLGLPPIDNGILEQAVSNTAKYAAAELTNDEEPDRKTVAAAVTALHQPGTHPWSPFDLSGSPPSVSNASEDEENPLAGMGFSDGEYLSMLQNLISAGSVSDTTDHGGLSMSVAGALDVYPGEGTGLTSRRASHAHAPLPRWRSSRPSTLSAASNVGPPLKRPLSRPNLLNGDNEKRPRI